MNKVRRYVIAKNPEEKAAQRRRKFREKDLEVFEALLSKVNELEKRLALLEGKSAQPFRLKL